MAVIWRGTSEDLRNRRRRTIISKGGTTYKSKRTVDESGKLTIGANKNASVQAALQKAEATPPTVEQTARLQVNQGGALRKNQAFSYEGERFNPDSEVLNPRVYESREAAIQGEKNINRAQALNRMFPERQERFKQDTKKKLEQQRRDKMKRVTEPFLSVEGQKQRLDRGKDAIVNSLTGGTNTLTVSTGSDKVDLFLEKRASNAWLTTAEITLLKGAGKAAFTATKARVTGQAATKATTKVVAGSFARKAAIVGGRTLAATPKAFAYTAASSSLTTDAVLAKQLTNEEARALRNPDLRARYGQTLKLQAQEISKEGGLLGGAKRVGFGISSFLGSKEQYSNIVASQGLTATEQSALMKMRTARGLGEISGLLAAGVSGERAGRAAQRTLFSKAAPTTFKSGFYKGAIAIAPAGFVEGSSGEFVQQFSRGERLNFKRTAAAGGVGSLSAAAFGGVIVGAQSAKRGATRKGAEFIGNVLDPFEYPSDKLTDFGTAASRGFRKAPTSSLSFGGIIPTQSQSNSFTQAKGEKSSALSSSLTQSQSQTKSAISALSSSQSITTTKSATNPFSFTQTQSQSITQPKNNPFSFTQSQSITQSQSQSLTQPKTNPFSFTQTQSNVPVNAITNTQTNVPVINFRIPAAPIGTSLGGGGGGFSFKLGQPKVRKGFAKKPTVYSILAGKPRVTR